MAFIAVFAPKSLTAAQYDEVIKQLQAAGVGAPKGRLHHVCYGSGDQLQVAEIWESDETFAQFGQVLMPIVQQVGIDPGQPTISPVHSIIPG